MGEIKDGTISENMLKEKAVASLTENELDEVHGGTSISSEPYYRVICNTPGCPWGPMLADNLEEAEAIKEQHSTGWGHYDGFLTVRIDEL